MDLVKHRENILVLGGGDGLATRELLKYPEIKQITVVDLDKEMTDLAINNKIIANISQNSFKNSKVKILNEDAFKFLENARQYYNVIIIDLPDPNNSSLARLYSKEFYKVAKQKLEANGVLVINKKAELYIQPFCLFFPLNIIVFIITFFVKISN